MYDRIKHRIEERISHQPRVTIDRMRSVDTDAEQDTAILSSHVRSQLERHLEEISIGADDADLIAHPVEEIRQFGGLRSERQLERHFTDRLAIDIGTTIRTFDFTLNGGSRVLAPPYDREWAEGCGIAFGARVDGKVMTIPSNTGFSAAGIGFHVTVNEPALAAITPQGTYDFNWVCFEDLPQGRSRGGMGITIYQDGDARPVMSRQPVLWNLNGMTRFSGAKGGGRIADAASPAFGFGTVPLAPALVDMVPGSRYLVWVWCWQASSLPSSSGFIAFLGFSMPFVTVDVGPPLMPLR